MKKPLLLTAIRPWRGLLATLCIFLLTTNPLLHAAVIDKQNPRRKPTSYVPAPASQLLSETIFQAHNVLREWKSNLTNKKIASRQLDPSTSKAHQVPKKDLRARLKQVSSLLIKLDKQAMNDFASIEDHLKRSQLPEKIIKRHRDAIGNYRRDMETLLTNLESVQKEKNEPKLAHLLNHSLVHLERQQLKRTQESSAPHELPFGNPSKEVRQPFETQNGLVENVLGTATVSKTQKSRGPEPADLTETAEVRFTPRIQALATELEQNPIKIYTWVHNNIQFIPSFGSIQGADMTLKTRKGNAIDTASLLIALFRASGIHARYSYGTVDIPIEKAMNWVGGVNTPEAALNLLGQGGVPHVGRVKEGVLTHVRMEHTWAEAFVDFFPSRGVVNRTGDTWVRLDASFKQYEHIAAQNLLPDVNYDYEAQFEMATTNANYNPNTGIYEGLQPLNEQALQSSVNSLRSAIERLNPRAGFANVVGESKLRVIPSGPLSAGLPYEVVASSGQFAEVSENLRTRFKLELSDGPLHSLLSFEQPTVLIAGKKLAVAFLPDTEDDQNVLLSYLPNLPVNTPLTIENIQAFPRSLPGYLVNLKPVVYLDDAVVAQGPARNMGREVSLTHGFWIPKDGWRLSNRQTVVGEYNAVALNLQGIANEQLQDLRAELEAAKTAQESGNLEVIEAMDLVGDMLYGTVLTYFATNDILENAAARVMGTVSYPYLSHGITATGWRTEYLFGIPRNVSTDGLWMDITLSRTIMVDKNNDKDKAIGFNFSTGIRLSAMEHLIPEAMWKTDLEEPKGISAVKTFALAGKQGKNLAFIDQDNINQALPSLNLSPEIASEISSFVDSDHVAILHDSPVSFQGENLVGYILLDQSTGAAAFKISGGANGGKLFGFLFGLAAIGAIVASLVSAPFLLVALLAIAAKMILIYSIVFALTSDDPLGFANDWIDGLSMAVWAYALLLFTPLRSALSVAEAFLAKLSALMGLIDGFLWDTIFELDE